MNEDNDKLKYFNNINYSYDEFLSKYPNWNKYTSDNLPNDDLYENIYNKNVDKPKKFDIPDYAFFLSYGENGGLVPVGLLVISGCVDKDGKNFMETKSDDLMGLSVELSQCEFLDDKTYRKKSGGEKVYIPLFKLKGLIEKHGMKNALELEELLSEKMITPTLLSVVNDAVSEYMISNFLGDNDINLTGESLEKLDGTLVYSDGEKRVTNYTIMPVSFGRTKTRGLDRYYQKDQKLNKASEYAYVERYGNYDTKKDDLSLESPVREPGPYIEGPEILYEDGRRHR